MIQPTPYRVVRSLFLRLLRVDVRGLDECRDQLLQGRVLIRCNHVSFLDGVLVTLASPVPLVVPVDTEFSLRPSPARSFLRMLERFGLGEVVPMDVNKPLALKTLKQRLDAGANVLIFPEGKISETGCIQPELPGAKWLVEKTRARVLDMRIEGAERSMFFGKSGSNFWPRISLWFGCASFTCRPDRMATK